MTCNSINILEKFSKFQEKYSPRVVAEMNNYQFKLVRVEGEFAKIIGSNLES
jgi:hypothetical protein